jgi:ankyrin repeat protein
VGVAEGVEHILPQQMSMNTHGGEYGQIALEPASVGGHEKVVEKLASAGADVNAQGGYYGTALYAASVRGQEKVVEILVSAGADVNAQKQHIVLPGRQDTDG